MKGILLICDYAAPYKGNFIPSLEYLEDTYKDGKMVYMFPENAKNVVWMADFQENHRVYFMSMGFFGKKVNRKILKELKNILLIENIQIIHTHFLVYNYALFIAKHTFAKKIKIIAHIHNQFTIPSTKSAPIKKFVMEHSYDVIIGVSKSVADGLNKQIKHKNITYIDNAICFSRLDTYEKISLRDHENQKVVLMAGWPALVKGVDIAAKAILELRNDGYDIKLCIMQSGDFDQTRRCITETIGSYPDWVQILHPREDVATYYNAADVFLSASRTEGLSYAIIEASYSSAMIACSNLLGNSLDIPHSCVFRVGDVGGCKNAIGEAIRVQKENFEKKKIDRRLYIQKQYDISIWSLHVIQMY